MKMTFKQAFEEEAETFFQATTTDHFPIMRGRDWLETWGANDPDLQEGCEKLGTEIYSNGGMLVYRGVNVKC